MSIESLYCEHSLELICLKIQLENKKLQGIMLHEVGEAMLHIGLSASIRGARKGQGKLGLVGVKCNVPQTT